MSKIKAILQINIATADLPTTKAEKLCKNTKEELAELIAELKEQGVRTVVFGQRSTTSEILIHSIPE